MKKFIAAACIAMLCLVGCTKQDGQTTENAYVVSGVTLVPGINFTQIKDSLPEPVKYQEAASCYFDGLDKVFTYDTYEVRTYPVSGSEDNIQDICVTGGDVKTDKGIGIGSTLSEVLKAYGDDYTLTGKMYRYYYDGAKYVYFFILDDAVKYYGYAMDVE